MNRFVFVVVSALLAAHCLAKEIYFEFEHDPNYPQLVGISGVSYNFAAMNKFIEISATLTVYEEIDEGTNIKINVSPDFPYARFVNNMDVNLCQFCRRDMPQYARLIEASGGQFPERCPIPPGVYTVQNLRVDLDKFPLLWRGFNAAATITLHKNGRILSKWDLKGGVQM